MRLEQPRRAIEFYSRALELDDSQVGISHNLGLAYGALRDYAKARFFFERSLELDPSHAKAKRALERLDAAGL